LSTDIFRLQKSYSKNPFGLPSGFNLRKGFNDFLGAHPNWFVYVRRDLRYPYPGGFDPATRSPEALVPETFGLGYKVTYEKHRVRRVIVPKMIDNPIQEYGFLGRYRTIIYTARENYPQNKDVYLEVEWDSDLKDIPKIGKPINIIKAYLVDEVISLNEDEVTYFGCGCDVYDFTKDLMDAWLKNLGNVWVINELS